MKEHGNCPNCNADLNGGLIWDTFYKQTGSEEEADKSAKSYGATRTEGQWGRHTAIYDIDKDRTVAHKCPDCKHIWRVV